MKKVFVFILTAIMVACSSSSNDDTGMDPDPDPVEKAVAVDDIAETTEDQSLVLSNLLDNDTVIEDFRIRAFDTESTEGGTIEDNRDGTYTYTPKEGYVGTDTFTYSLCDRESPANCSTATVTITVNDEGDPIAVNDAILAIVNNTKTIVGLTDNDTKIDGSAITLVDASASSGSVVLNEDGSVSYTPQTGFLGEDTFTYTICDDDSPVASCSTATVTVTVIEATNFNIPSELQAYYEGVVFSDDSDLTLEEVQNLTILKHTTILSYSQRHNYLYNADADLNNTDNVVLMYSGESRYWQEYTSGTNPYSPQTFNTEHIYPQSLLSDNDAVTDLHHLRCAADNINGLRSNHPYVDGTGTYQLINGNTWFPGDEWKGDVARMVMYLNIRYGETFPKVGSLELFLKWNIEDPVSDFERQRNNVIYAAQGNRNPFIDNPYIATLIWGGNDAENTWQ